ARLGAGQDINWGEIIASGLPHVAKTTFDIGKATVKTYRDHRKAVTADQTISVIDKLSQKAQGPDLRKLSPEEFERRVERATKGTPAENMYVDANTLSNMLETNGRDPYEFTEKIGLTRQQFDEARSSGGDIKISTAKFAGRVADGPDNAAIKKHMRFGPDDMSHAQAQEHLKNFDKLLSDARIEDKKANQAAETNVVPSDISSSVSQSNAATSPSSEKQNNNPQHSVDRETRTTADAERARRVVRDLLHAAKNKPSGTNRKKNVGRAGDSVVQAVQDATGFDISNAQHSLSTKTIRDSLNNTTLSDTQLPVTKADIQVIPDIISSADRIISGGKNERGQPIIGYIKHMSNGETLYLQQTQTGPKTFTVNALTRYAVSEDLDAVSQTVLSDVRAKTGDNVKMTPVKKGDAQPLPGEDGKTHALPQENGDVQPLPQDKTGGKRASASEGRSLGGMGAGGITAFSSAGIAGVVGQFTNHIRDMANEGEPTAVTAMAQLNDWWGQSAKNVAEADAQAIANNDLAVTDGATILATGSVDSVTKTAAVDSGLQTQFSRDFQTYMLEGQVPSPELAGTFETARKWLTTAYVNSAAVNGKTSPEVAEVFNRMLVSDGQLEMARLDAGESGPVFSSAEAMGLSQAAYADFTAARQRSEDEASAEMLQSVMQPVRREQDKAYAQEKAAVRTQVEEQVNTEGHYRAIELMSNRRWLGDGVAPANFGDIRFDKAMLVERYGDEILNVLPRGSQTVYTDKDGLDPDDVASIFGYSSGDELLRLMVMAPSRNDRIDGETARIMRERHGDPLYDGTADLKAMDAIHNTSRGQWLETELKAVGRVSKTPQNLTLKDAHISAKATISDMSVQDAAESKRFLAAERRAAEEAERLAIQLSSAQAPDVADVTATPDDSVSGVATPAKLQTKTRLRQSSTPSNDGSC
uniref:PBECR3 domain-containing polyvalent protein n=1 Tax=Agrobacterium sp. TaxID=361 RepID=UPI0028A88101